MNIQVDWLAVVAAAVAAMVIGSLWYSKMLFGKAWQKMVGLSDADLKKGGWSPMVKAVVLSVITAYVLHHIIVLSHAYYNYDWVQTGLNTGFWAWLGFGFTQQVMNGAFEQRRKKLVLINVGNQLVSLLAMGVVLGYFLGR